MTTKEQIINAMYGIYFNDGVNPSENIFPVATLTTAKRWVKEQLKGKVLVDDNHPCSEDVFYSSTVARFEVYEQDYNTEDIDSLSPVYCSPYFYTEL